MKMTSEPDEHEQALALEMGYQRRQWARIQKLEKQMGEQVVRMDEVARWLQEQTDRHRNMERQVELQRLEAQNAQSGLADRCDDEREARQKQLHTLKASINSLAGKFDEMLCEAVRDLTHSHQKGQQELRSTCAAVQQHHEDLARDLGSWCKDLERLFREECAELVQRCTERCEELGREVAEERDTRRKELHGLRTSIEAAKGKFDEMLRGAVRDLTHSHQELRSSCDAMQRQHEDMVQDLGSRCKDLERLLREECAELVQSCAGRCADLDRGAAEERDTRKKELHGLRASIKGLEAKFRDTLHQAVQDLTDARKEDHEALRSSCDAAQLRHEDLAQEVSGRCKDLERVFSEELHGSVSGVERKSHELLSETTKDLSKLMHSKHKELMARVSSVEHSLASHTHEFTSTQVFDCGRAKTLPASSPTAGSEMQVVLGSERPLGTP